MARIDGLVGERMEELTLIKAGIRNRRGIFFGFAFLTAIIVVSIVTVIGVKKNYNTALKEAYEIYDKGEIFSTFSQRKFEESEMEKKLKESDLVESIETYDFVMGYSIECAGNTDENTQVIMKPTENLLYFNSEENAFLKENEIPRLKKGEIVIPYGYKNKIGAEAGETIKINFYGGVGEKTFTIKGFVQEPFLGSSNIGWKMIFISEEDFDEIYPVVKKTLLEDTESPGFFGYAVFVHPSEMAYEKYAAKNGMSSDKYLRELNLKTGFSDISANSSITRETSQRYTSIFIVIIMAVIEGVAILLMVIYLIVAGHNLSTELEIDYVNLGILKSQGFTDRKIRKIYTLEYLIVEAIGIIAGIIIAIPVERWLSSVFFQLTSILPKRNVPIIEALIFGAALFIMTAVYIYIFTGSIRRTTPVKAISNGSSDIYFSSRLNAPITKRCLGLTLGLRQITSQPKKYISILIVTSLLIFTAITVELESDYIVSRNALKTMGETFCDINFAYMEEVPDNTVEEIEDIVKKYADIRTRVYRSHLYMSINGENMLAIIKAYPQEDTSVYKGREIKYDNEIVITKSVAELLDLDIGDKVTIGLGENSEEYVIVGIFQVMSDLGKAMSMSLDGYIRLKKDAEKTYVPNDLSMFGMEITEKGSSEPISKEAGEKIEKEIRDKYGDAIKVKYSDFGNSMENVIDNFYIATNASKLMIYVLTFIFALVTVMMVCTKAFIQERTDIGITRAIGFTVGRVRRQFAARFLLISLIGTVIGSILGRLYSRQLLESLFSMFGVPHIVLDYGPDAFILPALMFAAAYLIFGYLASGKVKKVSSRELITE